MLIRLPITVAQLRAGNNSQKLKNEIRQLLYFLHRSENNLSSLQQSQQSHIFMNTENGKTDKSHIFRLKLTCKVDLKNTNKNTALANSSIYYTQKEKHQICI